MIVFKLRNSCTEIFPLHFFFSFKKKRKVIYQVKCPFSIELDVGRYYIVT